ncbi:uncharacterized protein ACA1_006190 [Acanthamoeba castellanii str. Neff]|uniref:Translation initiation factor 5A C-terminal domain-containing protein n=1 Tax=Acanthamoeba castellanii (strain ATCC 30010 / Neff) TaxID=1257118 RepID=L8HH38_ACACF|nr:uncharacterized protein ACA1_006190 [Acanthamoeba castellanii str. Neff]ELR24485.1 hypothetical protein ACA1_006190 [Acanthamoeba castellanii str. Neff]
MSKTKCARAVRVGDTILIAKGDGQLVALDSSGKTVTDLTIVSNTLRQGIKDAYDEVEEVSLCVVRCMGQQAVTDYVVANRNLRAQPTE